MRKSFFTLLILLLSFSGKAAHLVGGEISYQCVGTNSNGNIYQIRLTVYRDCNSQGAPFDVQAPITVYGGVSQNLAITTINVNRGAIVNIPAVVANPCLQLLPEPNHQQRRKFGYLGKYLPHHHSTARLRL
jgi:hypothetical protein